MSSMDIFTEECRTVSKPRGLGLYCSLLSVQAAGVTILLTRTIPLYRLMAVDFSNYKPDSQPWWTIAGMMLIQVAYWIRVRLQPPPPRLGSVVLGQVVLFIARISFVCATAAFTVMFLNRFDALKSMNYPPLRALVVLMMFFSLFCWTLELEHLAKALQGRRHEANETHRD